jgi:hypothetical protein
MQEIFCGPRTLRATRFLSVLWTTVLLGLASPQAVAREPAHAGQSTKERLTERPAGPWQGTWRIVREDPRLRTRAAQELLELTVWHDRGSLQAQVDWLALRAICQQPASAPCEWVGASGQAAVGGAHPRGLTVVLPVSADEVDPFVLVLHGAPPTGRRAAGIEGLLLSARGDVRYRVRAERVVAP